MWNFQYTFETRVIISPFSICLTVSLSFFSKIVITEGETQFLIFFVNSELSNKKVDYNGLWNGISTSDSKAWYAWHVHSACIFVFKIVLGSVMSHVIKNVVLSIVFKRSYLKWRFLVVLTLRASCTETAVRRCSSKWCSSATFLKRDSKHRCFPVNIATFLRTSFFYGALQVAAFVASIRLEIRFFSTFVASIRLEIRFFSTFVASIRLEVRFFSTLSWRLRGSVLIRFCGNISVSKFNRFKDLAIFIPAIFWDRFFFNHLYWELKFNSWNTEHR